MQKPETLKVNVISQIANKMEFIPKWKSPAAIPDGIGQSQQ